MRFIFPSSLFCELLMCPESKLTKYLDINGKVKSNDLIALAKHIWLTASPVNWIPSHPWLPITTSYTARLKTEPKPLKLSLMPQHLSNQVCHPHSGSPDSRPHIPPYSVPWVQLMSYCCTSSQARNTSFSFNANLNRMLSPPFKEELDLLHETI